MSKKLEALTKAVFYSQEKPETLAGLLSDLIEDTATGIVIDGSDVIELDTVNDSTVEYKSTVVSQFGDEMTGTVTLSLDEAVTGVSLSGSTVTVAKTVTDGTTFTLKAVSGNITVKKTVMVSVVSE